jgi:23S rRNA (guanine2069-N7)-methyltransferase / 23S rRNA (guanine2445-N2)-methyltransferase
VSQIELIATTAFGLEAVVRREIEALGYNPKTDRGGWIRFEGDRSAIARSNIWLRSAERVLVRLGNFEATDFDQLFDTTRSLPWEEWIPADAAFPVRGRSVKSQLSSVPACQRAVKKAIVERLREGHRREILPETGANCPVEIAMVDNRAHLLLDTTGTGLHKRGYRDLVGMAPLRETLAAALVQLSYWRPGRMLIDPFCGTGTILIEAAMIGRNFAPGLDRTFDAERWPRVDSKIWHEAREEARDLVRRPLEIPLFGSDRDGEVLSMARHHARKAGVHQDIEFAQRDFADLSSNRDYGCLITNPPYGQRIGEKDELDSLYESMPKVLRQLKTWSHYILTAYENFETVIGQKADRRRKLYNGQIACTYFQFQGPRPPRDFNSAKPDESETPPQKSDLPTTEKQPKPTEPKAPAEPAQPAFGGISAKTIEQGGLFRTRLLKRARHLRRWPTKLGITCLRLYDKDIPEIPLVVDRYEDMLHIGEYERPHDRTPAEHSDWLELMARTAAKAIEIDPRKVFFKQRRPQRGNTQHEKVDDQKKIFEVCEGGLRFLVNMSDYLDTGLFLDHRITRSIVRSKAKGKRFLNLFAYTGSFSVYAADGGATETTTVDLSPRYLEWAAQNMKLNGFDGDNHRTVEGDCLVFLNNDDRKYDLAVIDPPTFSNSKKTECDFDIGRDYPALLQAALRRMAPGGVIYFSTNFRRFKLDETLFPGVKFHEISKQTVPDDFRNKRIHRSWIVSVPGA